MPNQSVDVRGLSAINETVLQDFCDKCGVSVHNDISIRLGFVLEEFLVNENNKATVSKEVHTRESILDTAKAHVTKNRQDTYGPPEKSFELIAQFWTAYTNAQGMGFQFHSHDIAAMMSLLKIARIAISPGHIDNWTDLAGYAACGGEEATK